MLQPVPVPSLAFHEPACVTCTACWQHYAQQLDDADTDDGCRPAIEHEVRGLLLEVYKGRLAPLAKGSVGRASAGDITCSLWEPASSLDVSEASSGACMQLLCVA
jgi:hypothetical protein